MALIEMLTLEQPVSQRREIGRLFIPKFPAPLDLSDEDRNARWLSWLLFVRKLPEKQMGEGWQVRRPCYVRATVRRWEAPVLSIRGGKAILPWLEVWRQGLWDGLTRAPLVHPDFLMGITVKYEALPPDTELDDRPKLEGVQIVFIEES